MRIVKGEIQDNLALTVWIGFVQNQTECFVESAPPSGKCDCYELTVSLQVMANYPRIQRIFAAENGR